MKRRNRPRAITSSALLRTTSGRRAGKGKRTYRGGPIEDKTMSLAGKHPTLARQWHRGKNGALRPDEVSPGSHRRVWWRCPRDPRHEWEAVVKSRAAGAGCPFCAGKRSTAETSLAVRYPALARQWHPTKNGRFTPSMVTPGSSKRVWWRCRCGHAWQAVIATRALMGRNCPACAGKVATPTNSLAALHPAIARQWHPTKNGALRPHDVVPASHRPVWWRCPADPRHAWRVRPATRVRGHGCPICRGLKASPTTSLQARFPRLARQWHPTKNGALRPRDVVPGSNKKVWWRCARDPSHEWLTQIKVRAHHGHGCPICAGKLVIPATSLLELYPSVAAEWHPRKNGDLRPEHVRPGSHKSVWWRCKMNRYHEWATSPGNRTRLKSGCPHCFNEWRRGRGTRRRKPKVRIPLRL
jgi:putative zinc ribbon protein